MNTATQNKTNKRDELDSLWNIDAVTYEDQKPGKLNITDFDPSRVSRPNSNPEAR